MKLSKTLNIAAVAIAIALAGHAARATVITDGNSSATINAAGTDEGDQFVDYLVDGVDHLFAHGFFIGDGTNDEFPITDLNFVAENASTDQTVLRYNDSAVDPTYQVTATYALTGGAAGSGNSLMKITFELENLTENALSLTVFEYADFDTSNTPDNDTVTANALGNTFTQSDGSTAVTEQTVVSGGGNPPDAFGLRVYDDSDADGGDERTEVSFLELFNDGAASDLLSSPSILGPDNVTWAAQWDFALAPVGQTGSQVNILKDMRIVPEPATIALFGSGLAMMLYRRRRA